VLQVAEASSLPVLDVYTLFKDRPNWSSLLSDGLHLSEAGDEVLFEGLKATIAAEFPGLEPDVLPLDLPEHVAFVEGVKPSVVLHEYL
jgi:isoamyl acetate esterase